MEIEISLNGDVQVSRKLLRVGNRAVHARPAFNLIGKALLRIEKRQFDSEGRHGSGGWEPLKQATIDARGSDHPILDASGALKRSLTQRGGDNIFEATDEFLIFGTSDPKARFHQGGTSRMARRRPLEPTEAEKRGMVRVLQAHIFADEGVSARMAAALGA